MAHDDGLIFIGDQKVNLKRPGLQHAVHGAVPLKPYASQHAPEQFSEELLEKILRGVSVQKYADTVISSAEAFGMSPT